MTKEVKIGLIYGEGVGKELIGKIFLFKGIFEKKFNVKIKTYDYDNSENVDDIIAYLNIMKKKMVPVICGPLTGGKVYKIRKSLDLFCKIIELFTFEYFNPHNMGNLDIFLIRENTSGVYFGEHGIIDNNRVFHKFISSKIEIERLILKAIDISINRNKKISILLKSDGMPSISKLWRETVDEILLEVKDKIDIQFMNVDRGMGDIVRSPNFFDVILTPDIIGDIVADMLVSLFLGSRGMGASVNMGDGEFAIYQTIHGSAFDIVGKNIVNPVGQLLSLGLLFKINYIMPEIYHAIKYSIDLTLKDGYRTNDICESKDKKSINTDIFLEKVFEKMVIL